MDSVASWPGLSFPINNLAFLIHLDHACCIMDSHGKSLLRDSRDHDLSFTIDYYYYRALIRYPEQTASGM